MPIRLTRAQAVAAAETGRLPKPTEDQVQRVIVDGLRAHGYLVQITSRRVKKCRKCGVFPHAGDGVSKGVADLLIRHPTWPAAVWLALEIKKGGVIKWSSTEQKLLAKAGDIIVAQSLEQALSVVKEISKTLKKS